MKRQILMKRQLGRTLCNGNQEADKRQTVAAEMHNKVCVEKV